MEAGSEGYAQQDVKVRGLWTPRMRVISISDVAEGPEMKVVVSVLLSAIRSKASGTVSTT
jgi:hypothetical protein